MKTSDWQMIYTLYQCKNITKSAEILYMTQSNFTKRLQSIENELGVKVVNRSKKGVDFTNEGKYLALRAQEILKIYDEVITKLNEINEIETITLRIGVPNSFARFTLPNLLQQFHKKYPNIDFNITTNFSSNVLKMLQKKEIDLGFVRGDISFDGSKYLFSNEQAYIANLDRITLNDLPKTPQISYLHDSYSKKLFESWWQDHFSSPPLYGMNVNHGDTCREMVLNGLGYGLFYVSGYVENTNVYTMPLFFKDGMSFTRNTWLVYYEDELSNSMINKFINFSKTIDIK